MQEVAELSSQARGAAAEGTYSSKILLRTCCSLTNRRHAGGTRVGIWRDAVGDSVGLAYSLLKYSQTRMEIPHFALCRLLAHALNERDHVNLCGPVGGGSGHTPPDCRFSVR